MCSFMGYLPRTIDYVRASSDRILMFGLPAEKTVTCELGYLHRKFHKNVDGTVAALNLSIFDLTTDSHVLHAEAESSQFGLRGPTNNTAKHHNLSYNLVVNYARYRLACQ